MRANCSIDKTNCLLNTVVEKQMHTLVSNIDNASRQGYQIKKES